LHSLRTCAFDCLATAETCLRAWAMHALKSGGSVGTTTGAPGPAWAALPLAATYIQWLNAWVVIGLPAMSATELPGTFEPQAAIPTASTKKAPSARMDRLIVIAAA
jgi:hypothetical protein